jgi:hypothetical protein
LPRKVKILNLEEKYHFNEMAYFHVGISYSNSKLKKINFKAVSRLGVNKFNNAFKH